MPTEIRILGVSATRDTTILLKWLKREGDDVREGEPIAEIGSDKGAIEVEAETSGTLGELFIRQGVEVAPGEVAAVILGEDE